MKVTVQQRPEDSSLIQAWSVTFQAPGGTLGRSTDNHLTLPSPKNDIGRIQAALRITEDDCYLQNLSSMSHVSINGRPILKDQEVPLAHGDELIIGPYTLKTEDPNAPASIEAAPLSSGLTTLEVQHTDACVNEPDPLWESSLLNDVEVTPDTTLQTSNQDVFGDLFGPGTLPVGSVPDVSVHPFDIASAQHRNPEDPLQHVPHGDADVTGPLRDPLELLNAHDNDDGHNVFSDSTPSTLPSDDPLAPHRLDPMRDTLRTH